MTKRDLMKLVGKNVSVTFRAGFTESGYLSIEENQFKLKNEFWTLYFGIKDIKKVVEE